MNPSSIKKVFGIVSYFPDNDTAFHIETRRERTRRCSELLFKLDELWPDIDIMIIAQNWQDYDIPEIKNKVIKYDYDKLGILGARRELRKKFLESDYDYLIMLDDDGMIQCEDPSIYLAEIDAHPDGIGVIRHTECPLMLLAISKYIYSKIDMPDIEAEKGEGFEDDVFVANCFAQFPALAFDFSKDCITETSFKYVGEGKCPSTWARESNYDWKFMTSLDAALIEVANRNVYEDDGMKHEIDLIIPYVDASDKYWVQDFIKATGNYSISGVRFRSWNTLKYVFRGIAENMPFIRNVVLIVARDSQVPKWVNREAVRIVYHEDFIPAEFLPTFNSCTIESFLYDIPDLAEEIIYFNDDMFPINPLKASDFFTNHTPHIKFLTYKSYDKSSLFRVQCRAGLDIITDALKLSRYPKGELIAPKHIPTAMLRASIEKVGELCKIPLRNSVSKLRMPKNVNQHIYQYYQYFTDNYIDDLYAFLYMEIKDNLDNVRFVINKSPVQLVCLNDSDKVKEYSRIRAELIAILEIKFPYRCKYEI